MGKITFDGIDITSYIESSKITQSPVFVLSCPHRPPCQSHCPKEERIEIGTDVELEMLVVAQEDVLRLGVGASGLVEWNIDGSADHFLGAGRIISVENNLDFGGELCKYVVKAEQRQHNPFDFTTIMTQGI